MNIFYFRLLFNIFCLTYFFKFDCKNTLNDQLLEHVVVELEPQSEEEGWQIEKVLELASLPYSQLGTTYTLLRMPEDGGVTGTFNATLKFQVRDVDPTTGEPESDEHYDDSYVVGFKIGYSFIRIYFQLEEVEISVADHVQALNKATFSTSWDQLGETNQVDETYALSTVNTLQDAVQNLLKYLGMGPCERSEKVPDGKSSHTLLLAGRFRGGVEILAKARLALDPVDQTVTMNIIVRQALKFFIKRFLKTTFQIRRCFRK